MSSFEDIVDSHITKVQKLWSTINSTLQSERQAASPLERSYCEAHYYKTKGGNLQKELRVCVQHLHSLENQASEQRLYSISQKIKDVLDVVEQQPTYLPLNPIHTVRMLLLLMRRTM